MWSPGQRTGRVLALLSLALAIGATVVFGVFIAVDTGAALVAAALAAVPIALFVVSTPEAFRRWTGVAPQPMDRLRDDLLASQAQVAATLERHLPRPEHLLLVSLVDEGASRRGSRPVVSADIGATSASFDHRLALVGRPGAGKTTALVMLHAELLDTALRDPTAAVPVFLPLSTWDTGTESLMDWFGHQVAASAGITVADGLRLAASCTPILDGLDELPPSRREECARRVAAYAELHPRAPIVLSCRADEFARLNADASGALSSVTLHDYEPERIAEFLRSVDEGWAPVADEIQQGTRQDLAATLATPLMLSVALFGFRHADPSLLLGEQPRGEDNIVELLWRTWCRRASIIAGHDVILPTSPLARGLDQANLVDLRFETLGSRRSRVIWYGLWGTAFGVLSVYGGLEAFIGASGLRVVRMPVLDRVSRVPLVLFGAAFWLALGVVQAIDWPTVPLILLAAFLGAASGWPPDPVRPPWLIRRGTWTHGRMWAVATAASATAVAIPFAVGAITGAPFWSPLGLALGLGVATVVGLDYAGHHGVARLEARLVTGRSLTRSVEEARAAGVLRSTGQGLRFFHLELQAHLSRLCVPGRAYTFANASTSDLFDSAIQMSYRGNHEEALRLWDRILAREPKNSEPWYQRHLTLIELKRTNDALESLDHYLRHWKKSPEGWSERGWLLLDLHRPEEAIESFDRALGFGEGYLPAHEGRALAYMDLHRPTQALVDNDPIYDEFPSDPLVVDARVSILLGLKRLGEALDVCNQALSVRADDPSLLAVRGAVYAHLDRFDEAIADCDRALSVDPESFSALESKGWTLLLAGHPEDGRDIFRRLLDRDDGDATNPYLLTNLGMAESQLGRSEEALKCFDAALATNPRDPETLYNRAIELMGRAPDDEVLRAFEAASHAMGENPETDPGLLFVRGHELAGRGEPRLVADVCRLILRVLAPDDVGTLSSLATSLMALGVDQQAAPVVAALRRIEPQQARWREMDERLRAGRDGGTDA